MRFLWTHKEADLALHLVVGLVLQVGDTEKFPHALGFTAVLEGGGDKRLVELELACSGQYISPKRPKGPWYKNIFKDILRYLKVFVIETGQWQVFWEINFPTEEMCQI